MLYFFTVSFHNLFKGIGLLASAYFVALLSMEIVIAGRHATWNIFLDEAYLFSLPLTSIGLAMLTMSIAFLTQYYEFSMQRKLFAKPPFSMLSSLGFQKVILIATSLWKLHKEVYLITLNDYVIVANICARTDVSFTLLTKSQPTLRLPAPDGYSDVHIFPRSAGLVIKVPAYGDHPLGLDAIKNLLLQLTDLMKHQGYTPSQSLKNYERMLKADMISWGLSGGLG